MKVSSLADRRLWEQSERWHLKISDKPQERTTLLLGAGASVPLLPTARELKREILAAVSRGEASGSFEMDELKRRIDQEHITLEVFCSMLRYRCSRFDVLKLWDELCTDIGVNPLLAYVAELRRTGWVGPILTTNFDRMIPEALAEQDYSLLTEIQLASEHRPGDGDVCALHGTTFKGTGFEGSDPEQAFAPPVSAMARGLARPYPRPLHNYLSQLLTSGRKVLVIGHSGRDYYDMNPLLAEFRANEGLTNWLWLSFSGDSEEMARLGTLVGPQNVLQGKATQVFEEMCQRLGLPPRARETDDRRAWTKRLHDTIAGFDLRVEDVRQFRKDLEVNLPGAWVVQEHYRLYSAGYDEGDTLTFGGVAVRGIEEAAQADMSHLDFLAPPSKVPFGDLLQGQFAYRLEDDRYVKSTGGSEANYGFPLASRLFKGTARRIDEILSPRSSASLRPEDRALLLVGKAIATDYLGLIQRKRWLYLGEDDQDLRLPSLKSFRACTELAREAGEQIESLLDGLGGEPDRRQALDDLVQHWVWELIGIDNVARSLDRGEAIPAFKKAIALRQELIDRELTRQEEEPTTGTMNDYLLAHYPQLWLRASELVKVLLCASGNTEVPQPWSALSADERSDVDEYLRICREAYEAYLELTGRVHHSFPAYFEVQIIYWAARASSAESDRQREAALAKMASAFDEFREVADRNKAVSLRWVENVEARTSKIRASSHDGVYDN